MNQIKYIYLMLVSFAIILMLLPLLNSGFFGDDAANSFINGNLQYNDQNLAQGILNNIKIWLEMGRFFPINLVIINCIFAFANNLILYKSLIILSILANILLFAYFIRIITNSPSLGFLSMLVMPILFQFRNFHDPILGYSMHQQSLFLFIIISLIFFVFYMESTKSRYLYISLFMYILSILTYEIALPFFLLYCLISYLCCAKKRLFFILKVCTPHFLVLLAYLLIIFVIQINLDIPTISDDTSPSRYSGIIPNLNIEDFIITFAKQNIAAFPLSYQISNHMFQASFNLNNIKELFSTPSIFIAIIYFVLSVIILNYINKEISEKNINELNVKCLLIMGLFILITPSIFVALSTKYQKELYWGVGYLPVYISYFGVTIIFICIIHHMLFRISLYNKNINIIFKI